MNKKAKEWGIPQPTLDRYVKGKTLPDFEAALTMANAAGIGIEQAVKMLAKEERLRKQNAKKIAAAEKIKTNFNALASYVRARFSYS